MFVYEKLKISFNLVSRVCVEWRSTGDFEAKVASRVSSQILCSWHCWLPDASCVMCSQFLARIGGIGIIIMMQQIIKLRFPGHPSDSTGLPPRRSNSSIQPFRPAGSETQIFLSPGFVLLIFGVWPELQGAVFGWHVEAAHGKCYLAHLSALAALRDRTHCAVPG